MKKKILLPVVIVATALIIALIGFLLFATNYKKTYTFDNTYKLQITREVLTEKEMISIANRQDKFFNKDYDTATFSGKEVDVLILVYASDSIHANVIQTFKCNKMIWKKTPYKIENNLYNRQIVTTYRDIINYDVIAKYEEYPLCKSKNVLTITFCINK